MKSIVLFISSRVSLVDALRPEDVGVKDLLDLISTSILRSFEEIVNGQISRNLHPVDDILSWSDLLGAH